MLNTLRWVQLLNLATHRKHLLKLSIESTNPPMLFFGSTFVTNWRRFTEFNAPQTMFSTWTPAPTRSSVATSSSTSAAPLSKTTHTRVRSVLRTLAVYPRESDCVVSPAGLQEGSRMQFFNQCLANAKVWVLQRTLGWIQRQKSVKVGESEFQRGEFSPTFWCFSPSLSILAAELVSFPVTWRRTDRRPKGGARRSETSRSCRWRTETVRTVSLWILVRNTKTSCFIREFAAAIFIPQRVAFYVQLLYMTIFVTDLQTSFAVCMQ